MKIGIFGAGRSSFYCINYLHTICLKNNWQLTVYDNLPEKVPAEILKLIPVLKLDIENPTIEDIIKELQIVVSLVPAHLHFKIANYCVHNKTHFINASYLSPEINELNSLAIKNNVCILTECGLDPGIDHMSTCKVIDELKANGAKITALESYCGGLIHPQDCENNPWQYKFAWAPMNVVLAGQNSSSTYLHDNKTRVIQWHQLFNYFEQVAFSSDIILDVYPNRDSLKYRELYNIPAVSSIKRGTLRHKGFCKAWNQLVIWGLTDNVTQLSNIGNPKELLLCLTGLNFENNTWESNVPADIVPFIHFLNFNSLVSLPIKNGTPSLFLLEILLTKWKLNPSDRDQTYLYHKVEYEINNKLFTHTTTQVTTGVNNTETAMAKLVGLPMAIATELIANKLVLAHGVQIPTLPIWYNPILKKLENLGVQFHHKIESIN